MNRAVGFLLLCFGLSLLAVAPAALVYDSLHPGWLTSPRAAVVAAFLALPLSLASLVIAYHVYRLQAKDKLQEWQRSFRELHEKFWSDDQDFATVRKWIACDAAYDQLKPILSRRLKEEPLTPDEYDSIEKVDRFCAVMLRVKQVNATAPELDDLTQWEMQSYYKWWFGRMRKEKCDEPRDDRKEFWLYIRRFWDRLTTP